MDTSSSKTISFEFNHCLTKLTLEIDTSQMPGVYMIKNDAATTGATSVKIPLTPGRDYDYSAMTGKVVDLSYNNASNNVSVVKRTEMFLAYPNVGVAVLEINELYLTDNPAVNVLTGKYQHKFNKILQPGKSYIAKVSVKKDGGGIVEGGVIWAPGFLYKASDGTYKFRKKQEEYTPTTTSGEYFSWNAINPMTTYSYGYAPRDWNYANDPCRKVSELGGGWRTPNYGDLVATGIPNSEMNGVKGVLMGNLFLPYAGRFMSGSGTTIHNSGYFVQYVPGPQAFPNPNFANLHRSLWSSSVGGSLQVLYQHFYDSDLITPQPGFFYSADLMPVRCCKTK